MLAHLLDVEDVELEERLARLDKVHRLIKTVAEEELPDGTLTTRYRFSHALYRDVLYGDVVRQRRVRLHRQIGQRLLDHHRDQASRIAAPLAVHFERGRDFVRAVDYLIQAGDNATRAYANAEAESLYSRALSLVRRQLQAASSGGYTGSGSCTEGLSMKAGLTSPGDRFRTWDI